jgi:hypothetical protein
MWKSSVLSQEAIAPIHGPYPAIAPAPPLPTYRVRSKLSGHLLPRADVPLSPPAGRECRRRVRGEWRGDVESARAVARGDRADTSRIPDHRACPSSALRAPSPRTRGEGDIRIFQRLADPSDGTRSPLGLTLSAMRRARSPIDGAWNPNDGARNAKDRALPCHRWDSAPDLSLIESHRWHIEPGRWHAKSDRWVPECHRSRSESHPIAPGIPSMALRAPPMAHSASRLTFRAPSMGLRARSRGSAATAAAASPAAGSGRRDSAGSSAWSPR